MHAPLQTAVGELISAAQAAPFVIRCVASVGGGCINHCYKIDGENNASFFVKINTADKLENLRGEYIGLTQLQAAAALSVPSPLTVGMAADCAVLVLEYLPLAADNNDDDWRALGDNLATLHNADIRRVNNALRTRGAAANALLPQNTFGARISNATLGARPGFLGENDDWAEFFCRHRLDFQFQQAEEIHGNRFSARAAVLKAAKKLLSHRPPPSLLHGDLWCGNAGFAKTTPEKPTPVVFDPAPYVGDAETDLALTELFGGFPPTFYQGYQHRRRINAGYAQRRDVYNLYHVLNHFNLFGGGYLRQAESMIQRLCRP